MQRCQRDLRRAQSEKCAVLLQNTVDYINSELDESEREEFFRLKKVQDKKKKEKALKQEAEKAAGVQGMRLICCSLGIIWSPDYVNGVGAVRPPTLHVLNTLFPCLQLAKSQA